MTFKQALQSFISYGIKVVRILEKDMPPDTMFDLRLVVNCRLIGMTPTDCVTLIKKHWAYENIEQAGQGNADAVSES